MDIYTCRSGLLDNMLSGLRRPLGLSEVVCKAWKKTVNSSGDKKNIFSCDNFIGHARFYSLFSLVNIDKCYDLIGRARFYSLISLVN